jgi:rod shape-determining protein MreB and related proteins
VRLRRALGAEHVAVDLGTANTVVVRRGEGVVLFEPSVVAINELDGSVQAVGEQARRMIGRTPAHVRATRPLRQGVIADFETTEVMLRYFIGATTQSLRARPHVIVCVPSGITQVERNAVEEATVGAGARRAFLIEEPLAGAIGAGLPVADAVGSLVVDVGGGTSEMAVTALGGMVAVRSVRTGGFELDEAIVRALHADEKLLIGQEQAEALKLEVGSALPDPTLPNGEVAGRDQLTGLLRRVSVEATRVHAAIARPLARIVEEVKELLEQTPPELAADIANRGITLVGGGALLRRFDELLRRETGLPVHVADDPLFTVALGAGRALEELQTLARTQSKRDRKARMR